MIKTLIIDDEEGSRETLYNLVKEYTPELEVVGFGHSVASGLEAIIKHKPDLVFLDIQMGNETGFDLLEKLSDINFDIIFTTAYDEYAVKAFKFSASDYLLKPIDIQELVEAAERVTKKQRINFSIDKLQTLLQSHKNQSDPLKRIVVPTFDGLNFIQVADIVRFEADGAYTNIHMLEGEKILVSKIIKEFDDLLSENSFFRAHQSHLINLNHIRKYVKGDGGYVVMVDNSNIPIARRKKDEFLQVLSNL